MVSFLVKKHIYNRAKDWNLQVPSNWEDIIKEYINFIQINNISITFSWLYDLGRKSLNANAMVKNKIILNAEWAARIVLYNNSKTKNAFLITIGHELTHKEKEISRFVWKRNDRKFIAQLNEIHADFGAAQKMVNSSRERLINSIDYKKRLKKIDKGDFVHPSWKRRGYYANNFNFNKTLVYQVANDTYCKNARLVEKTSKFYEDIILK